MQKNCKKVPIWNAASGSAANESAPPRRIGSQQTLAGAGGH